MHDHLHHQYQHHLAYLLHPQHLLLEETQHHFPEAEAEVDYPLLVVKREDQLIEGHQMDQEDLEDPQEEEEVDLPLALLVVELEDLLVVAVVDLLLVLMVDLLVVVQKEVLFEELRKQEEELDRVDLPEAAVDRVDLPEVVAVELLLLPLPLLLLLSLPQVKLGLNPNLKKNPLIITIIIMPLLKDQFVRIFIFFFSFLEQNFQTTSLPKYSLLSYHYYHYLKSNIRIILL